MPQFQPVVLAIAVAILVVALTALARRLPVPTPILQVLAGFVVTIVPGIAIPALDPDLVFFVFLPSILWSAAMFTSVREFRRNAGSIGVAPANGLSAVMRCTTVQCSVKNSTEDRSRASWWKLRWRTPSMSS